MWHLSDALQRTQRLTSNNKKKGMKIKRAGHKLGKKVLSWRLKVAVDVTSLMAPGRGSGSNKE